MDTFKDYENWTRKHSEFIEYNKPKVLEFLQNVPFEEFTAAMKNKLGVENLEIKYEIKEDSGNNLFDYYVYYTSNNLAEESKLLNAVYREYILETFGFERVSAYLQDGRRYTDDIFTEEIGAFDVKQPLKFELTMGMDVYHHQKSGGQNGCGFGYAVYSEDKGWEFNWSE